MIRYLIGAAAIAVLFAGPAQSQAEAQDGHDGLLKICKVAGPNLKPNTTAFSFAVNGNPIAPIVAGPAPGGNCWIGGVFPIGSTVVVTETIPAADVLTNVTSTGPFTPATPPPVSGPGSEPVKVLIGPGVTEVTFTNDQKKLGYLEICKIGLPGVNYTFSVNQGAATVTVAGYSCSPAVQVPSGTVSVTETNPGSGLQGCYEWQGAAFALCPPANGQTVTVTVAPGGLTNQTVVAIFNKERGPVGTTSAPDEKTLQQMMKAGPLPGQ